MEIPILIIYFISIFLFSRSALPWYFEQRERIRRQKSIKEEYEVLRKKSFLENIRPVLQAILKLDAKFAAVSRWIENNSDKYEPKLLKAGFPGNLTGSEFLALKQLSAVFIVAVMALGFEMEGAVLFIFLAFGFILPNIWLNEQIKTRIMKINRTLPDALDTFALVVGAGLNFNEALSTYLNRSKANPLTEEFTVVRNQVRLGRSLSEALQNMADRVGSSALTNFVTAIVQSQKTGTSLSEVLDAQAVDIRGRRFHIAEEMGQKAPIKMVFPLLLFIMPNVFIILFAPMVLKVIYGEM